MKGKIKKIKKGKTQKKAKPKKNLSVVDININPALVVLLIVLLSATISTKRTA